MTLIVQNVSAVLENEFWCSLHVDSDLVFTDFDNRGLLLSLRIEWNGNKLVS